MLASLREEFPSVDIVPVNIPESLKVSQDIDIYWGNRITTEIIENCNNIKWIHFGSVGTNRAQTKRVLDKNITITNSQGLVIAPMVASALAFITGLARGVHRSFNLRHNKNLTREKFDEYFDEIQGLEGQRLLIVGLGDVGQRLAKVCDALGMNVIGIRQHIEEKVPSVKRILTLDDLHSCASEADYIVNLLPLTEKTERVFGERIFRKMKSSAFFINIGRGETVDEDKLIVALSNNWIAGAGLDVFAKEPLANDSQLWSMKNVMLSPHVAGLSSQYWLRQVELFSFNLHRYIEGNLVGMRNVVDMRKVI